MKLSRDLSNLVVFTNSVASQECLNEGERPKQSSGTFTHTQTNSHIAINLYLEDIFACLTLVSLQVLQVTFFHSARPEPSLWSITEPNNSWLLTRGSCHGFIPQPIGSTRPISTPSSTGTWVVSWVRQLSVALSF